MKPLGQPSWIPPPEWLTIDTIDMHTGGEPLRILVSGLPEIKGKTILEKRNYFRDHYDFIRTGTMWEPRGHADMYGAVLTDPVTEDGDFGIIFMHNEGYSTMCGHATIAVAKLILETDLFKKKREEPVLQIDGPPGRIIAKGRKEKGEVTEVIFQNVSSFVFLENGEIIIDDLGKIRFDIAYGGAFYAIVEADKLGMELIPENYNQLISTGRKIKLVIQDNYQVKHPFEQDLSFLYGVIFTGRPENETNHSRNVCIFAEGELDRSATGSGISARAALHYQRREMNLGEWYTVESILGTTMNVKVKESVSFGPYQAVIPEVSGTAFFTGRNSFSFDPKDPLKNGFIFR